MEQKTLPDSIVERFNQAEKDAISLTQPTLDEAIKTSQPEMVFNKIVDVFTLSLRQNLTHDELAELYAHHMATRMMNRATRQLTKDALS